MVALAASGERKFVRYAGQNVDAVYVGGNKVYGRNLWRLANSGEAQASSNSTIEVLDDLSPPQHYKIKFTVVGTVLSYPGVIRTWYLLYPNGTTTTYAVGRDYLVSFMIKPSLPRMRLLIYFGNHNSTDLLFEMVPDQWNLIQVLRRPTSASATGNYGSTIGLVYRQADNPDVNLIGQTLEIKELKAEEYEYSPYSLHALYF